MINQSSHLSLAHGKFQLTRSNVGHDLKTYMNANIKRVKTPPSMVWRPGTGTGRSVSLREGAIPEHCHTPSPGKPSWGQLRPSHQRSQGQRLDSHWKSFPENRRSWDQPGLRRSHWLGDYRERLLGRSQANQACGKEGQPGWAPVKIHYTGTLILPKALEV